MQQYTIGKEYEILFRSDAGTISVRNDKGTSYYLSSKNFKLIESVNIKDDYQNF